MTQLICLLPLVILIMSACSISPNRRSGGGINSLKVYHIQQKMYNFSQYQIRGTLTYFLNQKKVFARFFWRQTSQYSYRLLLINSLGGTIFELNTQSGQTQINNDRGKRYNTADIEGKISAITGTSIPFNNLRQWILGLPGNAINYTLDNQYRLKELYYSQNGKTWRVVYNSYDSKTTPPLPSSMELIEHDQCIKLKINHWSVKC